MSEESKYDLMCIQRGDVEYLRHVADCLKSGKATSSNELANFAEALTGIANVAVNLTEIGRAEPAIMV